MTRHKKEPYTCPRCSYTSEQRSHMRKHLYNVKKPCPATKLDVFLSPEVKEYILTNRIYHPPKLTPTINQTINNYNTMNNFIANMDTVEKIQKLMQHQQTYLLDFDSHVERTFQPHVEELKSNVDVDKVELGTDDIVDLVDVVTKVSAQSDLDAFNVVYDKDIQRLKIYSGGEWSEFITLRGIRRIVETIQDHYLHRYECYLIRKINKHGESHFLRQRARELLDDYYKFLSVFDVMPFVQNHRDRDVLYDKTDDRFFKASGTTELCDSYMDKFKKISNTLTKQELNKIQKSVCDIVKQNSKRNVDELNKQVLNMLNADEQFKASVIPIHVLNS